MIVMKFGGTSVESAEAITRVAGIVRSRMDGKPLVVVSAMGKTTNKLLAIAAAAVSGDLDQALLVLGELRDFHLREAAGLDIDDIIHQHFRELDALARGLAVMGELTPRATDAISAYGERISSVIVAAHFRRCGLSASHVDARSVIVTDQRHTQAAPLFPQTNARLQTIVAPSPKITSSSREASLHPPRMASPLRSAAVVRTTLRPSSARASARRKFKSGPTSTVCSPSIPGSLPVDTA